MSWAIGDESVLIRSFLSKVVLPGLAGGGLCGLLEALALHYTSDAEYRDAYLFVIGAADYALAGVLVVCVANLFAALVRRKGALLSVTAGYAVLFGAFCALVLGVTGARRGWHHTLSRWIFPEHPWITWAVVLSAVLLICCVVAARILTMAGRSRPGRSLFSAKGQALQAAAVLCVAGGLTASVASTAPSSAGKPNILLIVMDTMRADALSCYGNPRIPKTTPAIDAIAAEGALFERAYAQATWTAPSHASIFTGLYVPQHGMSTEYLYLAQNNLTIAEFLNQQSYNTIGLSNNTAYVNRGNGLAQGFDDRFHEMHEVKPAQAYAVRPELEEEYPRLRLLSILPFSSEDRSFRDLFFPSSDFRDGGAAKTTVMAARWMARYRSRKPFFMFINYLETHHPYTPSKAYRDLYLPDRTDPTPTFSHPDARTLWNDLTQVPPKGPERLLEWMAAAVNPYYQYHRRTFEIGPQFKAATRALYDAKARYLDDQMGKLFAFMRRASLLDNTVLIIMSDHGESFGEHRVLWHLPFIYDSLIRIPLIVRYPARVQAGQRVARRVQTIDIFPTLEELAGARADQGADQRFGSSLLEERDKERLVLSQITGVSQPTLRATLKMMKTRIDREKKEPEPEHPRHRALARLGRRWRTVTPGIKEILEQLEVIDLPPEETRKSLEKIAERLESRPPLQSCFWTPRIALLDGRWKYIWRAFEKDSLYDLSADPGEENDLIDTQPKLANSLYEKLVKRMNRFQAADITEPIRRTESDINTPLPGYIQ